jgi:molybdopterin-guanine dinucleotide biosynthesis protein A
MKSAVILAGGKSTRMGIDKCTVLFHGKPLIYWPVNVLNEVTDEVIISVSMTKDVIPLKNFFKDEVSIIKDERSDSGPIEGILSTFKMAKGEYIALSPCDSPLLCKELYLRLFDLADGCDGAVPMVNGFWEPLHGVYKKETMISAIEKIIEKGENRPIDTYEYLNIKKLTQDEIMQFDPELASFVNINFLSDLQKASGILQNQRLSKSK